MDKYKADGPFVYELFACLVHQGGAQGGHYNAYILDKQSQTWFNFNDSRVSAADVIELCEMFGGQQQGRTAHSSTNAYMLMYRLCGSAEMKDALGYDIPADILQEIKEADQVKESPVAADTQLRQQQMSIKVVRH